MNLSKPSARPGEPLSLFFDEPDPDRWVRLDRYPRAIVRRIIRGPARVGGYRRVFLNLCAGLDRLGVRYRINDYGRLRRSPSDTACVVGQPFVLDKIPRGTPIIFGSAVYSHPIDHPTLFEDHNIRGILVPCEWVRQMFEPYWHDKVHVWPVGIDTDTWAPALEASKDIDVLVYDKVRRDSSGDWPAVRDPILAALPSRGLRVATIRYGDYREEQFHALLKRAQSMVFLSKHETQGIALLQTLSCGVPVFAWDFGGVWPDPKYYPHRVRFGPVTSVPYWDDRCGMKFRDMSGFHDGFAGFWSGVTSGAFDPRSYVTENLTLEAGARHYLDLVRRLSQPVAQTMTAGT